jgi:glycosyltransferase involved in cell wall biosynthesis
MTGSEDLPFVSLLMPVRNEGGYLRGALDSVLKQDYPPEKMEILVIDGMSEDNTRAILAEYQAEVDRLFIFDNPRHIVPTGMNIAMRCARGTILIRVDGHCEIAPDYVQRCVYYLENDLADGVGGPMETIGQTAMARMIAIAMSSPFGVGNSAFRTVSDKTMFSDTVPFPAYKRSVVQDAGGYDEELVRNQDDEYNYRLREKGYRILLAADIRSRYYSRSSLSSLRRQYFQYGYWKVRVLQKHPRQMSLRQFVPALLVGTIILSTLVSFFHPIGSIFVGLSIGAYILANLTASIITASHRAWDSLWLLPLGFGIIHFSYGLGFLAGLFKFSNRWRDRQGQTPQIDQKDEAHAS